MRNNARAWANLPDSTCLPLPKRHFSAASVSEGPVDSVEYLLECLS